MSWQILIGISVVLYSFSVVLQRIVLREEKSEPISFSIFFQSGVAIIIGALVLIIEGKITLPQTNEILPSLITMTLLYAMANIFIFKALKATEASRFTVIFSSKTVFAVIGISIIFSEKLDSLQWVGAFFILIGVALISLNKMHVKMKKGDLFALIAAILFGAANTNDRFLIKFFEPFTYVVVGFILPAVLIAFIYPKKVFLMKNYFKKQYFLKMILLCLLYGLSALTFFQALRITPNASLAFAINSFGGILPVILSIIILKEKESLAKKLVGSVLSLIGLLLINS